MGFLSNINKTLNLSESQSNQFEISLGEGRVKTFMHYISGPDCFHPLTNLMHRVKGQNKMATLDKWMIIYN